MEGEFVRFANHKLALQDDEREASLRIEAAFEKAGLQAPAVSEVLAACGVDQTRARTLLQLLFREGRLADSSEDFILHSTAAKSLKETLASRKGQRFSVGDFKDWTGVSRKYAIPLLESVLLDREHITRRDGDAGLCSRGSLYSFSCPTLSRSYPETESDPKSQTLLCARWMQQAWRSTGNAWS